MRTASGKESKGIHVILIALAVCLTGFQMLTASPLWIVSGYVQAGVHWALVVAIYLLADMQTQQSKAKKGFNALLVALSILCVYGLFKANYTLTHKMGLYSQAEIALAVCQIVLAFMLGYKILGKALPIISAIFLAYALFGSHITGLFKTARVTIQRLAPYLLVSSEGMFGTALITCARFIFIFILFGAVLDLIGAGEFFVNIAFSLTRKAKGGAAQASIYSSMLMGMISGSGPANVVTTGTFTIPLMKKIGFDPNTAGAVEAVASGGGQIMPPVMGSVAFIMSEVTGISYGSIALAALIPAVLYYITLSGSVYAYSYKHDVSAVEDMDVRSPKEILGEGWFFLLPLIVLIGTMIMGKSAQRCALWATVSAVAVGVIFRRSMLTWDRVTAKLITIGKNMATISCACLVAGIITGCINITGFGLKISGIIELISGGNLLIMLILTMFVCLILGMGLPTSASYVVLSVLVAPAIVKMNVPKMAAHLFILHFGSIATLTPPVALAVFAACGISGGTLWKTGGQALRLAAAGLIVPFIFVYNHELLLIGEPAMIVFAVCTALIGCLVLSFALIGWGFGNLSAAERLILLACSIALIMPRPVWLNLVGMAACAVILGKRYRQFRAINIA